MSLPLKTLEARFPDRYDEIHRLLLIFSEIKLVEDERMRFIREVIGDPNGIVSQIFWQNFHGAYERSPTEAEAFVYTIAVEKKIIHSHYNPDGGITTGISAALVLLGERLRRFKTLL